MEQLTTKQFIAMSKKLNKLTEKLIGTNHSAEFYTRSVTRCRYTCRSSQLIVYFNGDLITPEIFEIRDWLDNETNLKQLAAATARVNELLGITKNNR